MTGYVMFEMVGMACVVYEMDLVTYFRFCFVRLQYFGSFSIENATS